jgi:hypothetical protein
MNLRFGAMADSLKEQVESQAGIIFTDDELKHFQANADAVTRLNLYSLISDSQAQAARKKIVKKMELLWKSKTEGVVKQMNQDRDEAITYAESEAGK